MTRLAHWRAAALLGGFDSPGIIGAVVLVQDVVVDLGVDVLRVDEEAIDVEDTGPNCWERDKALHVRLSCFHLQSRRKSHSCLIVATTF